MLPTTILFVCEVSPRMDVDSLITAVFNKPAIWDKRKKEHANRNIIDEAWKDISAEINFDESHLRKKWKSLRDYFVAEYNRIPRPRSGDGAENSSSMSRWQYFNQMLFLKDIVTPRASFGTFAQLSEASRSSQPSLNTEEQSVGSVESGTEDLRTVQPEETDVLITTGPTISQSSTAADATSQDMVTGNKNPALPQRGMKRRMIDNMSYKYKDFLEIEKEKLEYLKSKSNNSENEDDDLQFFKSLLPYTRKIPPNSKLLLRSRILNVVTEFVCHETRAMSAQEMTYSTSNYGTVSSYHQSQQPSMPPDGNGSRASSTSPSSYQSYESVGDSSFLRY